METLELTVGEVARYTGNSEATLRSWKRQGKIPEVSPGGKIDGSKLINAGIQALRNKAAGVGAGELSLEDAKIRLTTAQADHREMLNARLRGELIASGDMEEAVVDLIMAARSRLLALPTQAAPRLVGVTDPLEAQRVLKELVTDALRDLSSDNAVTAVYDRGAEQSSGEEGGDEDPPAVGAPAGPDR